MKFSLQVLAFFIRYYVQCSRITYTRPFNYKFILSDFFISGCTICTSILPEPMQCCWISVISLAVIIECIFYRMFYCQIAVILVFKWLPVLAYHKVSFCRTKSIEDPTTNDERIILWERSLNDFLERKSAQIG